MFSTPETPSPCDVIGVGANSVDYVNRLPAYPEPQGPFSKMRIREQAVCCGGQTATALAACARLGLRARYLGATGTDGNGKRIREELAQRGVDASEAVIRDVPNQFAVILVDEQSGERIVLWDRDERLRLRPREIARETIAAARLVHVDDVDQPAAILAARLGREAGLPVTSDIDRITDLTADLVAAVTIPIFAEHVPSGLTGIADMEEALRVLRRTHDGLLIVTLGAKGALALDGDRFIRSPGFLVSAVDTTGAGDVFRGGLIFALLRGWGNEQAIEFANAAAAISCTRLGAMEGVPSLDEVEQLLASPRRR
ncbi:MAG TPA: PfkB family carbohydrate kinase [Vicinamibacterales bacterium]|nr:PfkB family carbohydrate kinase [Vicinamibacterales bacterium]